MSNQATLAMCNLVSRGKTVAEAKKILSGEAAPKTPDEPKKAAGPKTEVADIPVMTKAELLAFIDTHGLDVETKGTVPTIRTAVLAAVAEAAG